MGFLFQQVWEFPLKLLNAGNGDVPYIRVVGMIPFIILVIIFGYPELLEGKNFSCYFLSEFLVKLLFLLQDDLFLFLILIKDDGAIL